MRTANRNDGIGAALALALLLIGLGSFEPAVPAVDPASPSCASPRYLEAAGSIPEPGVYGFCGERVTARDLYVRAKGREANLADHPAWRDRPLSPGTRVVFGEDPSRSGLRLEPMSAFHRMTLGMAVPLNRASAQELTALPGVGPHLARAITEHRREAGGIDHVEDLLEVRGIGPQILDRLRPHVVVP